MMTSGISRQLTLLSCLFFVSMSAIAGSSATAITTISANIVPVASFSAPAPLQLNELPADDARVVQRNQRNPMAHRRVILGTASPADFKLDNSQNLVYDLSVPSSTRVSDPTGRISTRIEHSSRKDVHDRNAGQFTIQIDEAILNNSNSETGQYRGLIDITVNYN